MAISPCKIPKSIFKSINSICTTFPWNGRPPRVALETLRLPSHLAGLAFPDFYRYYQASQLVNIHDWLHPDSNNTCTTTEGAIVSLFETLHNIIYCRCTPPGPGMSIIHTSLDLFKTVTVKRTSDSWLASPNSPLWYNPTLKELNSLPDPKRWTAKEIKYFRYIYTPQGFKSFSQMRLAFNLHVPIYSTTTSSDMLYEHSLAP